MSKPRVGFFSKQLYMGGAERWQLDLARHLDRNRFEYLGLAIEEAAGHPAMLAEAGSLGTLTVGRSGLSSLAARCDIGVHWGPVQSPPGPVYVWCSHGCSEYNASPARRAAARGDHLAAVSHAAAQVFPDSSRVVVLHNGFDLRRCRPIAGRKATRAAWGVGPDQVAVGYLGRIAGTKNPAAAAGAARALGRRYVPVYVGPVYGRSFLGTIRKACPWAIFSSESPHVGDALAALDCFVLASPAEGFSLTLLEAWGAGLPTVATPVGAVPELEARHGPLTVSVPVDASDDDLAAAVRHATNPELNGRVVRRAQHVARSYYTVGQMAQRWSDYLVGLCCPAVPEVSVLMSVYNGRTHHLRQAWDSISGQTFRAWELVLVDDGSTDEAVVREIDRIAADPLVRLVRLPTNRGLAVALNVGLQECGCELVARMDADDVMLPERLSRQVAYMRVCPEVDILGTQVEIFSDDTGEVVSHSMHPEHVTPDLIDRELKYRGLFWLLNHPTVMYRRSKITRLAGYDEELRFAQDLDLWVRAGMAGLVMHNLPDTLLRHRAHSGQSTRQAGYESAARAAAGRHLSPRM